jgi:homoserine O-acetyltransferase
MNVVTSLSGTTRLHRIFSPQNPFVTEDGYPLPGLTVAYETHGRLNNAGTNVILVCHALTGDAHVAGAGIYPDEVLKEAPLLNAMKPGQPGWWDGMVGPGKTFDTDRFFVVCSNIVGSCYGSTGPASINPATGEPYRMAFPKINIRDMVKVQYLLLQALGVNQIKLVTGGSLGGMQALEWAVMYPDMVLGLAPIATAAQHSAWCIAIDHIERDAIMHDPAWMNGNYIQQPEKGLALARKIGMISYRSDRIYQERFARTRLDENGRDHDPENMFQVESYLRYQGEKLVRRFDANSYLYLTWAMDHHDLSRDRGQIEEVLGSVTARCVCIGIDTDILYPAHEQQAIAKAIPGADYAEIRSPLGHDAFLVEFGQLDAILRPFLAKSGN